MIVWRPRLVGSRHREGGGGPGVVQSSPSSPLLNSQSGSPRENEERNISRWTLAKTFLLASINSGVFQLKRGGFFQCIKFGWNNIALVDLISIFKNRHKKHTIGEGAAFVYLSGTTTPGSWYSQWHLRTIVQKVYTPSCTVHGSSHITLMNGFQDLIFISLVCVSKNVYLSSSRVQSALFLYLSRPLAAMSVTALSNPILLQLTDINLFHRHQLTDINRFHPDFRQILSHISQIYIWYT